MKVVHIESGLGNQMLSYCEYLALKKVNPNDDIYIENIIYDIKEANDYINQWNGYELEKIFGIKAPNIKDIYSKKEYECIVDEVKSTEFWKKNWNYPVYISQVLNNHGLKLKNIRGDFEKDDRLIITKKTKLPLSYKLKQTSIYSNLRRIYFNIFKKNDLTNDKKMLYYNSDEDIYTGQRLTFKFINNDIDLIKDDIKSSFIFPKLDEKNMEIASKLENSNSVAIHVRMGDMLYSTGKNFKNGYFKRATKIIKDNVNDPLFCFFCDETCQDYCKSNLNIFGLNYNDNILFVSSNVGDNSYKDMQLMTLCKHNIITNSSFGWWGAYLNDNPNKITISPEYKINTTHHC